MKPLSPYPLTLSVTIVVPASATIVQWAIVWLTNPAAKPSDYARPGHIFPLRAKTGGVLRRTGHTEAAVDLARLAGLAPVGVVVEILTRSDHGPTSAID